MPPGGKPITNRQQTGKTPQQTGAGKRLSPRQRQRAPARWRRSAALAPALRHTASGRKAPPIRAGRWSARAGRRPARASAVRRARPSASRWRPAARQSPGCSVRIPKAPHCSGAGRREPPIIFRTSAGKPYRPVPDCVFQSSFVRKVPSFGRFIEKSAGSITESTIEVLDDL